MANAGSCPRTRSQVAARSKCFFAPNDGGHFEEGRDVIEARFIYRETKRQNSHDFLFMRNALEEKI